MDMTRGLFRGKRTDNGEWVTGYFLADTAPCSLKAQGKCKGKHDGSIAFIFFWNDECHEYEETEIDPSTRGEYTGLTDRNEKMIFEGDIIRADWRGKKVAVVTFENGMFKAHGLSLITWVSGPGYCPEVIGNIHDNPELMGGQDG